MGIAGSLQGEIFTLILYWGTLRKLADRAKCIRNSDRWGIARILHLYLCIWASLLRGIHTYRSRTLRGKADHAKWIPAKSGSPLGKDIHMYFPFRAVMEKNVA